VLSRKLKQVSHFSCLIVLHFAKLIAGKFRPFWQMEKSGPRIMALRKSVIKQVFPAWLVCAELGRLHFHTGVWSMIMSPSISPL